MPNLDTENSFSLMREVSATSNTIDEIGYPTDIKKAIAEYIWNGFDASASVVCINYNVQEPLGAIESFDISDNGMGIIFENLDTTFRPILDSPKKESNASFYTRGKRGKGRFSFLSFSSQVKWETIYKKGDELFKYNIQIANSNKHKFLPTNPEQVNSSETGTKVSFQNFDKCLTKEFFECQEFSDFLKSEFGWFLHLHKSSDFKLKVNGIELDFESIIQDSDTKEEIIEDGGISYHFSIHYILWTGKIGEDSQNYYLNSMSKPLWNEDNGTNKKGDNFFNSVYIIGNFFDNFENLDKKPNQAQTGLFAKNNKYSEVFKKLSKVLEEYLLEKKKLFLKSRGDQLLKKLYNEGVMPHFGKGRYEEIKKQDFEEVVKEIYIFEPQIFEKTTNKIQKQTILEFLKLLLDDEKRDFIIETMKGILQLDDEQTKEFSEILNKTRLSGMINLTKSIIRRQETILQLKKLVFELIKFTTERDHIQKIIEKNYWLFGEQYNLVSADKQFTLLKKKYLEYCGENEQDLGEKITSSGDNRRPDIFLARTRDLPSHNQHNTILEHIIVELKRPTQSIGKDQYRQIEDYMEYIKNDPILGSKLNSWKFYLVGDSLETYITDKYLEFEDNDDPFLIGKSNQVYRIYALKWSDLFRVFENSHKHFLDELELDDEELLKRLELDHIELSREQSDKITSEILNY